MFSVNYTPMPIRFDHLSDEGIDCVNEMEIWFIISMILTIFVASIALIRAYAHRYDFKKIILPRYKWFGINHCGTLESKRSPIPNNIFAKSCRCFDYLGLISKMSIFQNVTDQQKISKSGTNSKRTLRESSLFTLSYINNITVFDLFQIISKMT